jgi:hypothetical protein
VNAFCTDPGSKRIDTVTVAKAPVQRKQKKKPEEKRYVITKWNE